MPSWNQSKQDITGHPANCQRVIAQQESGLSAPLFGRRRGGEPWARSVDAWLTQGNDVRVRADNALICVAA